MRLLIVKGQHNVTAHLTFLKISFLDKPENIGVLASFDRRSHY